jgi:hypothetical protein
MFSSPGGTMTVPTWANDGDDPTTPTNHTTGKKKLQAFIVRTPYGFVFR